MKLQRNRNYSILIESTIEIRFGFFQQQKIPLQHLVKMSQQDKAQQQNHTIMKRWALKSKMRLIWCSSLCFIIYFFLFVAVRFRHAGAFLQPTSFWFIRLLSRNFSLQIQLFDGCTLIFCLCFQVLRWFYVIGCIVGDGSFFLCY